MVIKSVRQFSQKASERLNFDKKKIIQVFLEVNQFSDGVERKLKGNFNVLKFPLDIEFVREYFKMTGLYRPPMTGCLTHLKWAKKNQTNR